MTATHRNPSIPHRPCLHGNRPAISFRRAAMCCLVAAMSLVADAMGAPAGAKPEPIIVQQWDFRSPDAAAPWHAANHLTDLAVQDGVLRMTMTGPDAYLIAPPLDVPLDGCHIRIRLRSDREGYTQIYWQTDGLGPFREQLQQSRNTPGRPAAEDGDGFVTVQFSLGGPAEQGRKLTALRIDPYNGNLSGTVEIASVEILRLPPVVLARLQTDAARIEVGESTTLRIRMTQAAGMAAQQGWRPELPGLTVSTHSVVPQTKPVDLGTIRFEQAGVHQPRVVLRAASDLPDWELDASVIAGQGALLPLEAGLRTDRQRLDLVPAAQGEGFGAARWQIRDAAGGWQQTGWLMPLAEVSVRACDGRILRRHVRMTTAERSGHALLLRGRVDAAGDWEVTLTLTDATKEGCSLLRVSAELTGPQGGQLLDFTAPVLRADREPANADPLDRSAIFGGLEFLDPGWPSSSNRAVGDRFADRWQPHPFKVTLPVMAIEAAGLTTAMLWQPLDSWDGHALMPAATFASPNFLDGQPNHLMALSLPTIPEWREENEELARQPYIMRAERPLTLRCHLLAEPGQSVVETARRWYEVYGCPAPPPVVHDDQGNYDMIARHYGETMYWPQDRGWRTHWYLDKSSRFVHFMAAELITHAIKTGDDRWVRRTGMEGRSIIDAQGTLAARVRHGEAHARRQMAAMRPDGTWPYADNQQARERTREFTGGQYDSLGEEGSTSLGTCVQPALAIIRHAALSGEREYVDAATKALNAMMAFRVPRGAQVWEVHKDIPDIRAAALAVEAFHLGYQITGDRRYLDEASHWAWTGVPFAYSWRVPIEHLPGGVLASHDRDDWARQALPLADAFQNPHRQVTPFGTVPVLGPTFYVINWFGVIVQWCGLEWAWKVIELDADRPDPLLRYIADGVVLSGLQQTFDREPWVGLYPDVWDVTTNQATGAFISAMLPAACLRAQGRLPSWPQTWTRILSEAASSRRWHVSGWGTLLQCASPPSPTAWSVRVSFPEGQPNELLLAGPERPRQVRVEGRPLEAHTDPEHQSSDGWLYDEHARALLIRFTQPAPEATVTVAW